MPSPDRAASTVPDPVAHVERTADPAVLCWRCTSPSLAELPDGRRLPDGPEWVGFGEALVEVRLGTIEVRVPDASRWTELARPMHAAMLDALRHRAEWLFTDAPPADAVAADDGALVAAVQQVVDRAAGPITGAHGGEITVASVAGDVVTLRLAGACHGCRFTDDTVERVIGPALQRAHPQLRLIVEH